MIHYKAMDGGWTSLVQHTYIHTTSSKSEDFMDWLMVFFFYSFHELLGAQAGATRDSLLLWTCQLKKHNRTRPFGSSIQIFKSLAQYNAKIGIQLAGRVGSCRSWPFSAALQI